MATRHKVTLLMAHPQYQVDIRLSSHLIRTHQGHPRSLECRTISPDLHVNLRAKQLTSAVTHHNEAVEDIEAGGVTSQTSRGRQAMV